MERIYQILIIKGSAQYNAVRSFCDELQRAFCSLGHLVTMLDLTSFTGTENTELFKDYNMIFSFDLIGIELFNSMSVKPFFWGFLIDPPNYLNERIKKADGNIMVSCIDNRHVSYIDKYYKNIPWTCFMPHGGITGEIPVSIPYGDRRYEIVFFGSLSDINEINSVLDSLKKDFDPLISEVIDHAIQYPAADLNMIVTEVINNSGTEFDDDMFREFMYLIRGVDALRRFHKRCSIIKKLIESGISVDIWGNGWNQLTNYINNMSLLKIHGSVSYEEAKYIMCNSKILVNDMPPYYEGSHERVFAAMQCGCIVATDRSTYLEECFKDKEDIIFYDHDEPDRLFSAINMLLNDNIAAQHMIDNAYASSALHTWSSRAASILDIYNMIQC